MTVDLQDELTARIGELLADELVILAEAEDGSSVSWASRPLTEQEQASGVRFGEIHGLQETLLEAVEPVLAGLSAVTVAAVVDAAGRSAKDMLATLAEWRVELPASVADEVARALPVVEDALVSSFRESSKLVVKEAARQGVKLSPVVEQPVWVRDLAETVTGKPVARVLDVARDLHTAPSAVVTPPAPEDVQEALEGISPKGPVDVARQANHAVVNAGRVETVEQSEREPAWLWSSEVLDGNQCGPCARIDQTEWETLEEARTFYPEGQGYVNCEGGNRCRGTLVFVWED
mgnify:CR=1 FL=1